MGNFTGSFPSMYIDIGLIKIVDALPDMPVERILEPGSAGGKVGLASWKHVLDETEREPELLLVDNDSGWFEHTDRDTGKDTLVKVCHDLGLDGIPGSVNYKVSDVKEYLGSVENEFDLTVMRSVLQFMDGVDDVICGISNTLRSGGVLVNACLCFPDEDSRELYKRMIGRCLELSDEERSFNWSTKKDIEDVSRKYFSSTEVTDYYAIPFNNYYANKRFGVPHEHMRSLKDYIGTLLGKYPGLRKILSVGISENDFRVDIPYFVIRSRK